MKNSTLKVLAGVISASMALMAMISVVSADGSEAMNAALNVTQTDNSEGAPSPGLGGNGDTDNGDDDTNKGDDDTNKGDDDTNKGDDDSNKGDDDTNKGDDDSNKGDDDTNKGDDDTNKGDDDSNKGDDDSNKGDDDANKGDDNNNNGDNNTSEPEAPAVSNGSTNNRVGDGGAAAGVADAQPVSTAQAVSAITSVKSGGSVDITMGKDTVIPAKTIAAFADKYNATLTLNYSGVGITINSEDIDADVVKSFNFKTSARFLTRAETKAFASAKEVRQLSLTGKSLNGIDKVTVTFKMRGGSKGMTAKLLLRTANGKYILVDEAVVGSDRNVDFEITEAGNYIVYTGEADIEYEEAE